MSRTGEWALQPRAQARGSTGSAVAPRPRAAYPLGVTTPFRQQISDIARRFGLASVYAFGSRARELATQGRAAQAQDASSDVDIGITPTPGRAVSAADRTRLATELEDLLGVARVDVVVLSEAPPFLALEVVKGELLYCADPDTQAEEELYVLRRAGDLAPYERERRRAILGLEA